MPKTVKTTQIKVLDTSSFTLRGFPTERFDTLREAFIHMAEQLLEGVERFEVVIPGAEQGESNSVTIDARYVDFDEIDE
jgi:hypothetical protein